jgi:dipeptide/tripeptide permease
MKKFEIAGYTIFLTGLILKLLHIPFNAWVLMAALTILLFGYLGSFFAKNLSTEKALSGIATVAWLTLFLFLSKFYPFQLIVLAIAIAALAVTIIYRLKNKKIFDQQTKILFAAVLLTLVVFFMPPDQRYATFNIRFHHDLTNDYITMDKYSWFLYRAEKFDEAGKFSNDAVESAKRNNDPDFARIANEHREKIRVRNWEIFNSHHEKEK